jgi:hypothetical protein
MSHDETTIPTKTWFRPLSWLRNFLSLIGLRHIQWKWRQKHK